MDLVYLFRVLAKRKWIILAATILAAAIAWFLTRNEQKNYRSISRVSTGFAVPDAIRVNDDKFTLFDADVKFNNAINTWTSQPVMSQLSYELILHDLVSPNPFRHLTPKQQQSPAVKSINKENAIKVIQNKLDSMQVLTSFKPEEKKLLELINAYGYSYNSLLRAVNIYQFNHTDYIQVESVTDNPELSAYVVNNAFKQFIRYYRNERGSKSQESVDTLKSIMDKKKQELDEKNQLLRLESGGDATIENTSKFEQVSALEQTLTAEKNRKTENEYELKKVNQKLANLGTSTGSPSGLDNDEFIEARRQKNAAYTEWMKNTNDQAALAKYNRLKAEFDSKYASVKNPTTTSVDQRPELLNRKQDLEFDINASAEKVRSIEYKINLLQGNISAVNTRGVNAQTLEEEVKVVEREYFEAKSKYNTAYDMSASSVNNFRQVQIGQPAIEPEPSKRKIVVAMAGIITLLSCVLIIMLLTYLDSSVKTPAIFGRVINLKLISLINFTNLKKKDLESIIAGRDKGDSRQDSRTGNVFRESLRKLRYEIESTGKKIFLFTSTKKGQGKTTLIQALAYSLSRSNKRILIVDTNFCNNDLTIQMEAAPVLEKFGVVDGDNRTLVDQVLSVAKDAGNGKIFIIGSEGGDYSPSEVLPTENILKVLPALTERFDYIFLEGPPLNDFTDSRELVQYVDGVVAVFSAIHIIKQIDKESINFFKNLNGKFCGSVLNMVNLENVNVT